MYMNLLLREYSFWCCQLITIQAVCLFTTGGYAEPIYRLGDLIAQIDVIISLAIASTNAPIPYIRPRIQPMGMLI